MAGRLSFNEYDRVVYKTCGKALTDRPFSARREGQAVAWHLEKANETLSGVKTATVICQDNSSDIALSAVYDAVLKAYAKNICPVSVSASLLIGELFEERDAKEYVAGIIKAAKKLSLSVSEINVSRGDVAEPVITVTAVGDKFTRQILPSNEYYIVQVGHTGNEAGILLADKASSMLEQYYPRHFLNTDRLMAELGETALVRDLLMGTEFMVPALEGGIFTALWDMLEYLHLGCSVEIDKINITQLTVEICERLDITPYRALSGGCALFVTGKPEDAVAMCAGAGLCASVIGVLSKSNDRFIVNGEEKGYLERPTGDSYKIYKKNNLSGGLS